MRRTVIAFGELLWDVFPNGEALGGAPANFAYRVNSLGHDGRLVTRLGKDERGRLAAELLRENGMALDHVHWDDAKATGTVHVKVDAAGMPDFTIVRDVAYDYIEVTPELLAIARAADCFCFGTLIQRSAVSRRTLYGILEAAAGALKVLDLNLRKDCYNREIITGSVERADILKLNEDEAKLLAQMYGFPESPAEFARAVVSELKREACVVTLGKEGIVAANNKGEFVQRRGHEVEVVDTVGCGDAVTAGFVHCYMAGRPLDYCCDFANALGALVAQTRGGMAPIDLRNVERLAATLNSDA
jgi:fructokinase